MQTNLSGSPSDCPYPEAQNKFPPDPPGLEVVQQVMPHNTFTIYRVSHVTGAVLVTSLNISKCHKFLKKLLSEGTIQCSPGTWLSNKLAASKKRFLPQMQTSYPWAKIWPKIFVLAAIAGVGRGFNWANIKIQQLHIKIQTFQYSSKNFKVWQPLIYIAETSWRWTAAAPFAQGWGNRLFHTPR